jgi:asparagine N-glycosylation enzyme membrane subunit Stt3
MIERRAHVEPSIPGVLAVMVTVMVALAALTPYLVVIPSSNLTLITQAQTTLWNGWLLVLGFYFGNTMSQGKKDSTIQTLAQTAQAAGAALAPPPPPEPTIPVAPGESVTVTGQS